MADRDENIGRSGVGSDKISNPDPGTSGNSGMGDGDELERNRESGRSGSSGSSGSQGDEGESSDQGESDQGSSRSPGIGEDNVSNR